MTDLPVEIAFWHNFIYQRKSQLPCMHWIGKACIVRRNLQSVSRSQVHLKYCRGWLFAVLFQGVYFKISQTRFVAKPGKTTSR